MSGRAAVAIDVSAIPVDPRGAGRYVVDLVAALDARRGVELRLLSRSDDGERWRGLAPSATVEAVVPASRPIRLVWEQVAAARRVDGWPVDVYHGPHYTMPRGLRHPAVVTVHDLTFFDHPEWHERSKVAFFTRAITSSVRRAAAIVCVSEGTRHRLVELLDPQAEVVVIPHGIDHNRFGPVAVPTDDAVREHLGVRGRYVLFLGTIEPRKNVPGLIAAFDLLAPAFPDLQLVLAGGAGWGEGGFADALAVSPHARRIVRTGYLADADVPALLRGAAATVYPAFVEGFGLPALEAMACGSPLVTTAGSVMHELAGAAAVAVDTSPPALAGGIETALRGGEAAETRRRLGLAVAAGFTWDATAAAHERVYGSASGRPL